MFSPTQSFCEDSRAHPSNQIIYDILNSHPITNKTSPPKPLKPPKNVTFSKEFLQTLATTNINKPNPYQKYKYPASYKLEVLTYAFNSSEISSQSIRDILSNTKQKVQFNKDPRINQQLKEPKVMKAGVVDKISGDKRKQLGKYEFCKCPDYVRDNQKLMEVVESKVGKVLVKGGCGTTMLPLSTKINGLSMVRGPDEQNRSK